MSGSASILPTGKLQFMPQEHILCGLCETSFMFCSCTGLTHGRNYVFANLPPPAANSTRSQLIQRWCSIVAMHPTMGVFGADQWYGDQGEALSVSMNERTSMLHDLVEEYIQQLPQDKTLSNLALIAGGKNTTRKSKAEQIKAVAAEARASLAIFLSGD